MKKIIALMLLLSNCAFGAVLPPIPTITIGDRVFTNIDPTKLITLFGVLQTGNFAGMQKMGAAASTAYQVTAGKTLHIYAIKLVNGTVSTAGTVDLGYGDTAVTLGGQNLAPTNPIYVSTYSTNQAGIGIAHDTAGAVTELAVDLTFIATKYVFAGFQPSTTVFVYAYGYEQ